MKEFWHRLIRLLKISCAILLVPCIAMYFTEEVNWSRGDFVLAFFLLFTAGGSIEILRKKVKNQTFRSVLIALVLGYLLLLWAELAVGLFESVIAGD